MLENFKIEVVDLPTREDLVAEIFYKKIQWAQISFEQEKLMIQFYSHPFEEYWEIPCDDALQALQLAKNNLLKIG